MPDTTVKLGQRQKKKTRVEADIETIFIQVSWDEDSCVLWKSVSHFKGRVPAPLSRIGRAVIYNGLSAV